MIINGNTTIEKPTIRISAAWQNNQEGFVITAIFENKINSYGRHVGNYVFKNGWELKQSAENTQDVNDYLATINISEIVGDVAFYTPPTLSNIGVIIPEKFEWVFANDRFEINGFVVDFARVNGQLAVDVAYIAWEAFQQELDLPTNATVKASLLPIWRHVETEFELGNIIKL